MAPVSSHPILTPAETRRLEERLFGGDEAQEWVAMQQAGRAVAETLVRDFGEAGPWPSAARLLVLVGKGHNGGDALLAAKRTLSVHPAARADVLLAFGERSLRPLALRSLQELVQGAPGRVAMIGAAAVAEREYDVMLDGVFGFQFRPPLEAGLATLFAKLNEVRATMRVAVDLPSGLGCAEALRADFTYATGCVKTPCVDDEQRTVTGRLRYLDLGFFRDDDLADVKARVLVPQVLKPLQALRPAVSDKRTFGHLFILGGSRSYPGAVLMSARAAARSGAGLVTAFVPESFAPAYAAQVPEVIWVGWPETPEGGLSLEGLHLFRERVDRATAMLLGPGMTREREVLALMSDLVKLSEVPVVIDADALQPSVVRAGTSPRILTPHAGEFARISGGETLEEFSRGAKAITVLKGPLTRISGGEEVYHVCCGGPVLARGGSGDVLAGLMGGLLAQEPGDPLLAACRGALWHGLAADRLARESGAVAVQTTQLIDHLAPALREAGA